MEEGIFVINPGSTSTKAAFYLGSCQQWNENIPHPQAVRSRFPTINAQLPMRKALLRRLMADKGLSPASLSAVVARGGLLPPVCSGAYLVNQAMLDCLEKRPRNQHASNLGAALAQDIAEEAGVPAYIYDPVTVDEMIPEVRLTGLKEMQRMGMGHNLNMRATALRYADQLGQAYTSLNLIVAHLGGGITLSLHSDGRIIDMISDEEGPFSPERAGGLPCFQLVEVAFRGAYTQESLMKKLQRSGGLVSHLGSSDLREAEARIDNGDAEAALVFRALALNISKNIAKLAVTVSGVVDAILLTGGMAYSTRLTTHIEKQVRFIAPVAVFPGENEMDALAAGALRVLRGTEKVHIFSDVQ